MLQVSSINCYFSSSYTQQTNDPYLVFLDNSGQTIFTSDFKKQSKGQPNWQINLNLSSQFLSKNQNICVQIWDYNSEKDECVAQGDIILSSLKLGFNKGNTEIIDGNKNPIGIVLYEITKYQDQKQYQQQQLQQQQQQHLLMSFSEQSQQQFSQQNSTQNLQNSVNLKSENNNQNQQIQNQLKQQQQQQQNLNKSTHETRNSSPIPQKQQQNMQQSDKTQQQGQNNANKQQQMQNKSAYNPPTNNNSNNTNQQNIFNSQGQNTSSQKRLPSQQQGLIGQLNSTPVQQINKSIINNQINNAVQPFSINAQPQAHFQTQVPQTQAQQAQNNSLTQSGHTNLRPVSQIQQQQQQFLNQPQQQIPNTQILKTTKSTVQASQINQNSFNQPNQNQQYKNIPTNNIQQNGNKIFQQQQHQKNQLSFGGNRTVIQQYPVQNQQRKNTRGIY